MLIVILAAYYAGAIFAYVKAQRVLERNGSYALPTAKVMRGGKLYMIRSESLSRRCDFCFRRRHRAGRRAPYPFGRACRTGGQPTELSKPPRKTRIFSNTGSFRRASRKHAVCHHHTHLGTGRRSSARPARTRLSASCRKARRGIARKLSVMTALEKFCRFWSLCMSAAIFLVTGLDLYWVGGAACLRFSWPGCRLRWRR